MTYTEKTLAFRDRVMETRRNAQLPLHLLIILGLSLGAWIGIWLVLRALFT